MLARTSNVGHSTGAHDEDRRERTFTAFHD